MAFHFDCPTVSGLAIVMFERPELETTDGYLPYACHGCGETHFVNPLTGRVLGRRAPRRVEPRREIAKRPGAWLDLLRPRQRSRGGHDPARDERGA
jgi:hypothetical protein